MQRGFNFWYAMIAGIVAVSIQANASADKGSIWQGDWRWDASDQSGMEYGGHLAITDCSETGCTYDLYTGSGNAVCTSDGRFTFRSPSSATHERMGGVFIGKASVCSITFEMKGGNTLVTDSDGGGCSYFCGANANFGGDFQRVSLTPIYRTSFDCQRAAQPLERTICSSKELAKLDLDLSQRYKELLIGLSPEMKQRLRVQQQQWLKTRDQTCGGAKDVIRCLEAGYRRRINDLMEWRPDRRRTDAEIQSVFEENKKMLFRLYHAALHNNPALRGKVILKFTILPSGAVSNVSVVSSSMNDIEFERKFLEAIEQINFGTKDVPAVTIRYPVSFFP